MTKVKSKKSSAADNASYVAKIALPLVVICALTALLVATVNYFTAPVIERNSEAALHAAIEELFALENIEYTEKPFVEAEENSAVDALYAVTSSGESVGYCVKLSPKCFKGTVDMIVSLDNYAFVTGVKIISTNDETGGIGTKVTEKSFTDSFIETEDNKLSTDVSDYVISGATKTSKPVSEAVFTAKRVVQLLLVSSNAEASGIVDDVNQIQNELDGALSGKGESSDE